MIRNTISKIIFSRTTLENYYEYLKNKSNGDEKHVLLACLPKSGSTFIAKTIVNITGYDFVQFQPYRATNEHNILPGVFYSNLNKNTVTQLHIKPSILNKKLLQEHDIKVVYLTRNILDSLRSIHHHILNENDQWFMFTAVEDYQNWHTERQFDFLIDLVLPWYVNFISSWQYEIEKGSLNILEVSYEDFKTNNIKVISKILKFYGLDYDNNAIKKGIDESYNNKLKLRFTKPETKINYCFTPKQMTTIERIVGYYPNVLNKIT